jgi:peroxiredoxin
MARAATPPKTGDAAPPLELRTVDGSGFRLEDERGRPVLLSFLRHAG